MTSPTSGGRSVGIARSRIQALLWLSKEKIVEEVNLLLWKRNLVTCFNGRNNWNGPTPRLESILGTDHVIQTLKKLPHLKNPKIQYCIYMG
jgi:hypothetical protein